MIKSLPLWKILSTKTVFKHDFMTLLEDEILLPNGQKTTYLKMAGNVHAVTVVAKNKDKKILLQSEYSHPLGEVIYQFPGGMIEPGEPPEKAANRELREESKIRANSLTFLGDYVLNNRRSSSRMYVFFGEDLQSAPLEEDAIEEIENYFFAEHEIDKMIKNGEIVNSTVLSAWCLYKLKSPVL